jgi:putative heme degradation protein
MTLSAPVRTSHAESIEPWIRLIQAEYLDMPGLHLTKPQIQRLWNLQAPVCDALVETMVRRNFLRATPLGAFVHDRCS